jgi:hypothetical protein
MIQAPLVNDHSIVYLSGVDVIRSAHFPGRPQQLSGDQGAL